MRLEIGKLIIRRWRFAQWSFSHEKDYTNLNIGRSQIQWGKLNEQKMLDKLQKEHEKLIPDCPK
jgi:hypothetical protein